MTVSEHASQIRGIARSYLLHIHVGWGLPVCRFPSLQFAILSAFAPILTLHVPAPCSCESKHKVWGFPSQPASSSPPPLRCIFAPTTLHAPAPCSWRWCPPCRMGRGSAASPCRRWWRSAGWAARSSRPWAVRSGPSAAAPWRTWRFWPCVLPCARWSRRCSPGPSLTARSRATAPGLSWSPANLPGEKASIMVNYEEAHFWHQKQGCVIHVDMSFESGAWLQQVKHVFPTEKLGCALKNRKNCRDTRCCSQTGTRPWSYSVFQTRINIWSHADGCASFWSVSLFSTTWVVISFRVQVCSEKRFRRRAKLPHKRPSLFLKMKLWPQVGPKEQPRTFQLMLECDILCWFGCSAAFTIHWCWVNFQLSQVPPPYKYTYTHTYTGTYTHTHTYIHTHTSTHTHTCTYIHSHTGTHTHIHTCACTHTHTHTHTQFPESNSEFELWNPGPVIHKLTSVRILQLLDEFCVFWQQWTGLWRHLWTDGVLWV